MRITNMTKTAWRAGDEVRIRYRKSGRLSDLHARMTIEDVTPRILFLRDTDTGDWLELTASQIKSIDPIYYSMWSEEDA